MLTEPTLPDGALAALLAEEYGVRAARVAFLARGADPNSAVYRVDGDDGAALFLKLRGGPFAEASVALPRFLHERGIGAVVPPLATRSGRLWARLGDFAAILMPFVAGDDGFAQPISARGWGELGAALGALHRATPPPALAAIQPREDFSSRWCALVRQYQALVEREPFAEPVAARVAATMRAERVTIDRLVGRAAALGARLRADPPSFVPCHADIHAGNVLTDADGALHIVDWDTAILAPKERDLMFIGAGISDDWRGPGPAALFYAGYGDTTLDRAALAYYRCARAVEDIAFFCDELLASDAGGAGRAVSLGYFVGNFAPGGVIAIALETADGS